MNLLERYRMVEQFHIELLSEIEESLDVCSPEDASDRAAFLKKISGMLKHLRIQTDKAVRELSARLCLQHIARGTGDTIRGKHSIANRFDIKVIPTLPRDAQSDKFEEILRYLREREDGRDFLELRHSKFAKLMKECDEKGEPYPDCLRGLDAARECVVYSSLRLKDDE